jgi:hypothetical protein
LDYRAYAKPLSDFLGKPPTLRGVPSAVCNNRVRLLPSTSQQPILVPHPVYIRGLANVYVTHIGCGTTTEASPVELDALVGMKWLDLSQSFEEASCALVNTCSYNTRFGGLERR